MNNLGRQIVEYGKLKRFDELIRLITETTAKSVSIMKNSAFGDFFYRSSFEFVQLIDEACNGITGPDGYNLWNYILMGSDNDDTEKMFQVSLLCISIYNIKFHFTI